MADYNTAAEMTKKMDAAYTGLRNAAESDKAKEGSDAYRKLAAEAIGMGLGDITNQPYAGRLFRGFFQGLDQLVAQLEATKDEIDPETRDTLVAQTAGKLRGFVVHQYLLDTPAKDEEKRPSEKSLDEYRVEEGSKAVRAIITKPTAPTP